MAKFETPKVYGTVTIGERGQIVIPAQLRRIFRIKPGDKLFVFARPGSPIGLVPTDQFNKFLTHMTQMLAKIKKKNPDIK